MVSHSEALSVTRPQAASPVRSRPVAIWLFAVAFLVFCMVVVGGATRLTGSGLSITQWKPVAGVVPPLSGRAWAEAFARYRASSQYRLVNQGITLGDFQVLFWWEWSHRLLGRTVGLVFGIPFAVFLATGAIPRRLRWRCAGLLALGGLQGLVGWWMVESGLEGRASVAPERLATHLGLALILFGALIWTGLDAWWGPRRIARRDGWTRAAFAFAAAVFLQCLLGAVVAGNHAGLVDSDWPLMAGRLFPEGYWRGGLWATFAHGMAAVQFNHRVVAYCLLAFALGLAAGAARSQALPRNLRALVLAILAVVPLYLALLHQANAACLFLLAISLAWRTRRA
jgi:cytochrome c oxidase assembly protein subunit 15